MILRKFQYLIVSIFDIHIIIIKNESVGLAVLVALANGLSVRGEKHGCRSFLDCSPSENCVLSECVPRGGVNVHHTY